MHRAALYATIASVAALSGCRLMQPTRTAADLLGRARQSRDSVTLETFSVRLPQDDLARDAAIWREVDESKVPPELRGLLAENGFRAGVVGGQLPAAVQELLAVRQSPDGNPPSAQPDSAEAQATGGLQQGNVVTFDGEPAIQIRQMQIRPDRRGEIVVSSTYDELPLLVRHGGRVTGQTHEQAQCVLGLTTKPHADGRVALRLVPEVHHGQPQRWFDGTRGVLEFEIRRPRETLDELALDVVLSPGEYLVLSDLPARGGSLGARFFADESTASPQRKLLFIRLAQTQRDELFEVEQ